MSTLLLTPAFTAAHSPPGVTRLAPSPTGALHLGNARTFLITWLLARKNQWKVLLRIEDIDSPRIKPGAAAQAIDDLRWLGIDFDESPLVQSQRIPIYHHHTQQLLRQGNAYPCVCSRSEIESAASAPHASDGAAVYPSTCRDRFDSVDSARTLTGRSPAIRFRLPDLEYSFHDGFRGTVRIHTRSLGDFPIEKSDGTPSYQLACALDDALTGVTQVVRGDDLLDSVPRQALLLASLGLGEKCPAYTHLPLVVGADGRRLAKRHGDTRISVFRSSHGSPARVLRVLAGWCGIETEPGEVRSASDLLGKFELSRVPRTPVTLAAEDLQVLL